MSKKKETFWDRAARYVPVLCRMLARHRNGPPLTTAEIAQRSGLSEYRIHVISHELSWHQVSFGDMHSFLVGCDLDLCDPAVMHRIDNYMKSENKFKYLKRSPQWKPILETLVKRFRTLEPK